MGILDMLPSSERYKRRKKLRSRAAYEKTRESIPSVEEISEQMDKNEQLAELKFAMESDVRVQEALNKSVQEELQNIGLDGLIYAPDGISDSLRGQLEQGITVSVDSNPDTNEDQLMVAPEGNVSEKLPIKFSLSEKYIAQFSQGSTDA